MFARLVEMLDTQTSNRTEQALHEASKIADPIDLQSILWAGLLSVHGHFRCKLTISLNLLFSFFAKLCRIGSVENQRCELTNFAEEDSEVLKEKGDAGID